MPDTDYPTNLPTVPQIGRTFHTHYLSTVGLVSVWFMGPLRPIFLMPGEEVRNTVL